jgi:hypothetical protein
MASYQHIYLDEYEYKEDPLWWQKQGLIQTVSGYGKKLTTTKKIKYNNRWYRIYITQYSNCSTAFIIVKRKIITIS